MAAALRAKKSSVKGLLDTFQTVNNLPEPVEALDDQERAYFDRIVKSRELSTWSDHDLALATQLAQAHVMYQVAVADIKINGLKITNDRGTPITNPATGAMNQLSSSIRSSAATLGLSAGQRAITGGKQAVRNAADRNAREVISRAGANGLLAGFPDDDML
jgi:P27 family predicted phage terminase small subunit